MMRGILTWAMIAIGAYLAASGYLLPLQSTNAMFGMGAVFLEAYSQLALVASIPFLAIGCLCLWWGRRT